MPQFICLLLLPLGFCCLREVRVHGRSYRRADPVGADKDVACCGRSVLEAQLYGPGPIGWLVVGGETFPDVDTVGCVQTTQKCFLHLGSCEGEAVVCWGVDVYISRRKPPSGRPSPAYLLAELEPFCLVRLAVQNRQSCVRVSAGGELVEKNMRTWTLPISGDLQQLLIQSSSLHHCPRPCLQRYTRSDLRQSRRAFVYLELDVGCILLQSDREEHPGQPCSSVLSVRPPLYKKGPVRSRTHTIATLNLGM